MQFMWASLRLARKIALKKFKVEPKSKNCEATSGGVPENQWGRCGKKEGMLGSEVRPWPAAPRHAGWTPGQACAAIKKNMPWPSVQAGLHVGPMHPLRAQPTAV